MSNYIIQRAFEMVGGKLPNLKSPPPVREARPFTPSPVWPKKIYVRHAAAGPRLEFKPELTRETNSAGISLIQFAFGTGFNGGRCNFFVPETGQLVLFWDRLQFRASRMIRERPQIMVPRIRQLLGALRPACIGAALIVSMATHQANALVSPFKQAVAEAAAHYPEIAEFYRANAYEAVWTGNGREFMDRRAALLNALENAGDHALPASRYGVDALKTSLREITSQRELGHAEVQLSHRFLRYARDLQSGVLVPKRVDPNIDRKAPTRSDAEVLEEFTRSNPREFLRGLQPDSVQYLHLLKAKATLYRLLDEGGWGAPVPAESLKPGASGPDVVALRNRLIAMGYMGRSAVPTYDAMLQIAVQRFQIDNGLHPDGVAGRATMAEVNRQVEDRIRSVIVALERERWMNFPRGERHIWVNLADFSAAIIDDREVTFRTRSVIGQNTDDRRSPEFSDKMEYMEINPSWYVPNSIAVNEYLPQMIETEGEAEAHLEIVDEQGEVLDRSLIDWSFVEAETFPFGLRQAPGPENALGYVKFMFPNQHNIYLHDTPEKALFSRERRAFSHGCIRLDSPFEFAYEILRPQAENPEEYFQRFLETGEQTHVVIEQPIPVHIVYRTALISPEGRLSFRRDVYGRDMKIFEALAEAGVALTEVGT